MNRTNYIGLSLLALLCCLTASADVSVTKCEYWFDRNFDSRVTEVMSGETWEASIDIADLTLGVHSIAMRVTDATGKVSSALVKYFMKLDAPPSGENSLLTYDYWIDRQFDTRRSGTVDGTGVVDLDLDIADLTLGLHSIAMQVTDAMGKVSSALVKYFMKLDAPPSGENSLLTYEYWIDRQFDTRQSGTLDGTGVVDLDLDIANLTSGLHSIAMRVTDATGKVSSALVKYFMKLDAPPSGENTLLTYEYWIDRQFDTRRSGTVDGTGVVDLDLDIADLTSGLHSIAMRVTDATGKVSSALVKYFMKQDVPPSGENSLLTYEYWIDRQFDTRQSGTLDGTGVVDLDLDIANLTPGLHTFNYRTIDNVGHVSGVVHKCFMVKKITEPALLVAIDYWFNDGSRTRIAIDPAQPGIDRDDIVIPLNDIEPQRIEEDYIFDVETKRVAMNGIVMMGLQVFNNEEIGSEAVVDTIKDVPMIVVPSFDMLDGEAYCTVAAPQGGKMAGFCYEGTAGDSIFWEMAGTVVKVDFFDADGNRLMPERKTIDDKDGFVMTMPTELVYALAYDATANGEVSMKVTLLQGAGIKRVPFERPMDVFTTNGILVRAKATSLDGLPDGIYVVGRSVYIHKVTNP